MSTSDYPDLSALEEGNEVPIPSAPDNSSVISSVSVAKDAKDAKDTYYYDLPQTEIYPGPPPSYYNNDVWVNPDDDNLVLIHNETTLCWALGWMIAGFFVWPCFIISFILIRPIRKELSSFSPQYCRVMSIYGIDVAGMVLGTIGTVIMVIELVYKFST